MKYNTAGAVVAKTTPWTGSSTRTVKIDYTDNFNDGISRNAYAYPKMLTDPAGFSSTVKYRYDIGANIEAQSPTPYGTNLTSGKHTVRLYDALGRLERETLLNTGAYTRYQYFTSGTQLRTFSTITAGLGEAESETRTDGAGRVIKSRTALPGSAGGWSGTLVNYDKLGRVVSSSVPTEIDANWNPAGDDLSRGFLWNSQEYDWKGRVIKQTNMDGTFKTISYQGCGCAGGQVTTVQGEEIFETDWDGTNPTSLGKRTQKIYADVLGRTWKTELLNWNGGSVYSSIINTFNGRDQVLSSTQTEAATSISQVTTLEYDGYGRVKTQKRPEQTSATTYNYNPDDSIQTVVDARGATTDYTYNSRGLVTLIDYTKPTGSTTVPDTADVSFEYDEAGNRKKMTDITGTVDYTYTELSQLKTEIRIFTDTLANAPAGGFKLTYEYDLAGQLKSLEDPYNQKFNYTHDKIGRLLSVTGATAFVGITDYANNAKYRAWGAIKQLDTGDGLHSATTYNERLRPATFKLTRADNSLSMDKIYDYYADGNLRKFDDSINDKFDRLNRYDFAGRILESKAGTLARSEPPSLPYNEDRPYTQTYDYDAFGQMKGRAGAFWNISYNYNYTFTNGRVSGQTQNGAAIDAAKTFLYDADGRSLRSYGDTFNRGDQEYDAAGNLAKLTDYDLSGNTAYNELSQKYDGDGQAVKRTQRVWNTQTSLWEDKPARYYIISSVVKGEIISTADATGRKLETSIFAAGRLLARQKILYGTNVGDISEIEWRNQDSFALSDLRTRKTSLAAGIQGAEYAPLELDVSGTELWSRYPAGGGIDPEIPILQPGQSGEIGGIGASTTNDMNYYNRSGGGVNSPGCAVFGFLVDCSRVRFADGLENNVFGALERSVRESRRQTGWRYDYTTSRGEHRSENYAANVGDVYLTNLLAEGGTVTAVYANNWSVNAFVQTQTQGQTQQPQTRQQLPKCLRDFLRPFFPSVNVNKTVYSPVDDARFISGIPSFAKGQANAITLGLFDIHYVPANGTTGVDLTGGKNMSSIGTIAEELAHTVQFLNNWASLGQVQDNPKSPNKRDSTYLEAQNSWAIGYLAESGRINLKNAGKILLGVATGVILPLEDDYWDNKFEKGIVQKRAEVENAARQLQKSPCYP